MRSFKSNLPRLFPLFFLAASLLFSGCETNKTQNLFAVTGSAWTIKQGQGLWTARRGAPQIGGDIVLASDGNGRSFVQFDKTPLTIVTAQTTPERWLIRFPQGGGVWAGHQPAPPRTIWLYLGDALAGKSLPKPLSFKQKSDGNWRLENLKTGEILEGFVSP
jgi:hypothetical protein